VPLDINQSTSTGGAWTQTELLDTTIAEGFPFYKVELYGRYPEGRQQGAKYTGVYFSVDGNAGEVVELAASAPTETAPANELEPTTRPGRQTAVPPTNTPLPTATALPEESGDDGETATAEAIAAIETPEPEPTRPAARPTQPARSTPAPDVVSTPSNNISPVYLVIIGVLLLIVIVLGIGWARATRR
jgi:cobalamin biosynthesis Mg chelatase CobN